MRESILSLFKKEQQWVNQSRALYKRATVSKLLSNSLRKSDLSDSLVIWANRSQKTSNLLKKTYFCMFLTVFHSVSTIFCQISELLLVLFTQLLFFKDQRDQFINVALYKRATVSKSLPSIFTKEQLWVESIQSIFKKNNGSCQSLKKSDGSCQS